MTTSYDALILVSFGGPESRDDVMPFLENVLRGKNVPRARMLQVAEHYYDFDGVSPINEQNRQLIHALDRELKEHSIELPIYWGNRNWHPMLEETLARMAEDGVTSALALFTSAYSCYSGCRQYRENIVDARKSLGSHAPRVDKIRQYWNHPGFVEANIDCAGQALAKFTDRENDEVRILFTAHSIPKSMADGCRYASQLKEMSRLIAEAHGCSKWDLVYQSRSGPPHQPWLEPDVCDHLKSIAESGEKDVVIAPIGFISDHMEVIYDLDHEARQAADELGLRMERAETVGTHPRFIAGLRELIEERLSETSNRAVLGQLEACLDQCAPNCCPISTS